MTWHNLHSSPMTCTAGDFFYANWPIMAGIKTQGVCMYKYSRDSHVQHK